MWGFQIQRRSRCDPRRLISVLGIRQEASTCPGGKSSFQLFLGALARVGPGLDANSVPTRQPKPRSPARVFLTVALHQSP